MEYRPGSLGCDERAAVRVASATAGTVTYALCGRGLLPGEGGGEEAVVEVAGALGETANKVWGCFRNSQQPGCGVHV